MNYIKADIIFPDHLLKEIQKYVHGEMIYIPNPEGKRRKWGESSGNRKYLIHRNNEIRLQFRDGLTIDRLSEIFCLSYDSIKKIVYTNK